MTDAELAKAMAELKVAQRRVLDAAHALRNILAVVQGDVELTVQHGRRAIEQFHQDFPELDP